MNTDFHQSDTDESGDFIDLLDDGLADLLGVSEEAVEDLLQQHPTLGPVVDRRAVCDLLTLLNHHDFSEE